ncbi:MAG: hypothetical protein IT223_07595, partial [Crocinitomicaceae bacterium]|nr:hypothetical protein [Crocinitomicaceae bacterium]
MIRRFFLLLTVLSGMSAAQAQGDASAQPDIVYNRQFYAGINVNTHGYGLFGTIGKNKGIYKLRLLSLDIVFVKHEKETKSYFQDPNARSYFYGKENNFYVVRPGFGMKKIIAEKLRPNGVQVGYSWLAGPALGFTKPVYLEILHLDESSTSNYYIEVEKFDPDKHYIDNIYG